MADYTPTLVTSFIKDNLGGINTAVATFDVDAKTSSAGLAQNDTIYGITVPSGQTVVDYKLRIPELDSNASPTGTFDFGIQSGDVDLLLDGVAMGGTATGYNYNWKDLVTAPALVSSGDTINQPSTGIGYTTTAETVFGLLVPTAVATAVTSGIVVFSVSWTANAY